MAKPQYFSESTRVLSGQYSSTAIGVLEYSYWSTRVFLLEYSDAPLSYSPNSPSRRPSALSETKMGNTIKRR